MDEFLPQQPALAGKTRFTEYMVRENRLDERGFGGWVFRPGMLFNAADKWWGDGGRRSTPHEGVDFCLYKDGQGRILRLEEGSRVPVMYDGSVVGIVEDFLGKSVIVAHRFPGKTPVALVTVYGHTVPAGGCPVGRAVMAGDVIATIAGPAGRERDIYPHLHVSLGSPSGRIPLENLDWRNMQEGLLMLDPLDVIGGPQGVQPFA
jgi:hypothetical protein